MSKNILKRLGRSCQKYRLDVLQKTQKDVAQELGYSKETISAFENGRNDNCAIFLYYVRNGILELYSVEELLGWWD